MAKKVRVLLLEHVAKLGSTGDVVTVSEGFARNSLFPSGKAALATDQLASSYQAKKARQNSEERERLATLHEKAEMLDRTELIMTAKVKNGTEIYGSITKKQILAELMKSIEVELKPKDVEVKVPIKEIGTYEMNVSLASDIECNIKLVVVADGSTPSKKDDEE